MSVDTDDFVTIAARAAEMKVTNELAQYSVARSCAKSANGWFL